MYVTGIWDRRFEILPELILKSTQQNGKGGENAANLLHEDVKKVNTQQSSSPVVDEFCLPCSLFMLFFAPFSKRIFSVNGLMVFSLTELPAMGVKGK